VLFFAAEILAIKVLQETTNLELATCISLAISWLSKSIFKSNSYTVKSKSLLRRRLEETWQKWSVVGGIFVAHIVPQFFLKPYKLKREEF
jgi:hypothetical protein